MRIIGTIAIAAVVLGGATAAGVAVSKHPLGCLGLGTGSSRGHDDDVDGGLCAGRCAAGSAAGARAARHRQVRERLDAAKADGYAIITQLIPGMGYHFINTSVKGFDSRKPRSSSTRHGGTLAARSAGVGLPRERRDAAAQGRDVRVLPGGLSLQGRHVRPEADPGPVPAEPPRIGLPVQLLAPRSS